MSEQTRAPAVIHWPSAALWYSRFLLDPLLAATQIRAEHGPFVQLPHPGFPGQAKRTFLVAIGPRFNREVLANPAAWRTVNIGPGGPKNSAVRRLSQGIVGMNGRQHEHYRRLVVPPLQRKNIDGLGDAMVALAAEQLATWPVHQLVDLWAHVKLLLRTFAIGLLFGDDRAHGYPVADMINKCIDSNWSWKVFACPLNLPGTPYHRLVQNSELLERRIIDWGECKRGAIEPRDLLSIVVNSPDEHGSQPSNESLAGHTPTLFGAAYETCQNALIWTLLLLDQHPQVACDLYDELRAIGTAAAAFPSYPAIMRLPLLDAVVKESMRILPPVPQQFRVAQHDTTLGGTHVAGRTRVLLSSFLTNREPGLYEDPGRFKPSRWGAIDPSPYEYSVFSAGPRGCPGYSFGTAMLKIAVAMIVARYRIVVQPGTRIDYKVRVALSPRRAIPAVLVPQDGAFAPSSMRGTLSNLVEFPG